MNRSPLPGYKEYIANRRMRRFSMSNVAAPDPAGTTGCFAHSGPIDIFRQLSQRNEKSNHDDEEFLLSGQHQSQNRKFVSSQKALDMETLGVAKERRRRDTNSAKRRPFNHSNRRLSLDTGTHKPTRPMRRHSIAMAADTSEELVPDALHQKKTEPFRTERRVDASQILHRGGRKQRSNHQLLQRCLSSSFSSREDGPPRRSRRPKHSNTERVPHNSQNAHSRRKQDQTKEETPLNFLNHSFNLSFNSSFNSTSMPEAPSRYVRRCESIDSDDFEFPSPSNKELNDDGLPRDWWWGADESEVSLSSPTAVATTDGEARLFDYACRGEWGRLAEECTRNPRAAKYVNNADGRTALHMAIISRADPTTRDGQVNLLPAPMNVIEQLIAACPEAAIIRCTDKKYTPLIYACYVADPGYDMNDSADMVRLLLKHAPNCAVVFTEDSYSALDVHIISYSRIHQNKEEVVSNGRTSTAVLKELLNACAQLIDARSYGSRVRGPVELLYRCNLKQFKEASGQDVLSASATQLSLNNTESVQSTLSDWWAWKWTLLLLETTFYKQNDNFDPDIEFSAVHASTMITGCPLPVICLAIDAFPYQVKARSPARGNFNTPLHEVCGWASIDQFDGDPFVIKRKSKAISILLDTFPKAARMTNNSGETPLQLAIETCTPWDRGLASLVSSFSRALTIPRCIDLCKEDSPLRRAVSYQDDDLGSVGFNEDEWNDDAIDKVNGMYPFMVAAVLSHVPERRHRVLFFDESKENNDRLEDKAMDSLRSIYGLLRARPEALKMYIEDEKKRIIEENNASSSTEEASSSDEESTEGFFEE